jgi:uncharacterized repeat protein (TIGR02543 family)
MKRGFSRLFKSTISMLLVVVTLVGLAIPAAAVTTSSSARIYSDFTTSPTYKNYKDFAKLYIPKYSIPVPGLAHTDVNGKDCTTMVPQGICFADDYLILSAYDSEGSCNSVLYVISNTDGKNRQYLMTIVLPTKAHVGGIAFDGTYLWVANGKNVSSIKYSTLDSTVTSAVANNKKSVSVKFYSTCAAATTASFLTYSDGMLWVGEFKDKGDSSGKMYSYTVSSDGKSLKKKYYITLPDRIQGACFKDGYLILSRSYNRNVSSSSYISQLRIYKVSEPDSNGNIKKNSVIKTIDLPPMVEGIVAGSTYMYMIFESAATKYYKGSDNKGKCKYPVDRIVAFKFEDFIDLPKEEQNNSSSNQETVDTATYFPACDVSCNSFVDALISLGYDSSMDTRKSIAAANNIASYTGTAEQNDEMLTLLKTGKLINPGVKEVQVEPEKVTIDITSGAVKVGQTIQIAAAFTEGSVSWKSSNTKVATVSKVDDHTVSVKGVSAGKATITCTLSNGSVAKCTVTVSYQYFGKCNAKEESIVRALDAQSYDSSFATRTIIAEANGITGYKGTAEQNEYMVDLMIEGKLINPGLKKITSSGSSGSSSSNTSSKYFDKCDASFESISKALESIGVDGSKTFRTKIAAANNISNYTGTAEQNIKMLDLLKAGKLLKPTLVLASDEYLVCFNANGGSGTMEELVLTNGSVLPKNVFTLKGYKFQGWATSASGSVVLSDKAVLDLTESVTLYAVWKPNTFTVTYNANGGTGKMSNTKVTFDVYTPLRTPGFTRTGYELVGWYRYRTSDNKWLYENSSGTRNWYVDGKQPSGYKKVVMKTTSGVSRTSAVDGDVVVLYAVWEKVENYNSLDGKTVMFIGNSFIYYGGVVETGGQKKADKGWFYEICKANGEDVTVIDCTYGGHHLYDFTAKGCKSGSCHKGKDLLAGVDLKSVDYVFISESGNNNSNFLKDVKAVMKRFPSKTQFFYLAHSYTYSKNHTKIINNLDDLEKLGVGIIVWGQLVDDIIDGRVKVSGATQKYKKNTFIKNDGDTYHPNPLAGYITAQMCYCAVTGKSAVGQMPDLYKIGDTIKYGKSAVGYSKYISKHYKSSSSSNFKAVMKSKADMKGLQKLMDKYLAKWDLGASAKK